MQSTSKPGGRTPIKSVWVRAADKVRVSMSRWHTPTQHFTEYPPRKIKDRYRISEIGQRSFLGFEDISH